MNLFIGIDFGTSGARLAVIDADGNLNLELRHAFAGRANQATEWQEILFALLREVTPELRLQVDAIAINGTSSTVLLCDETGQPLTEPLLYNDAQAASELQTLQELFDRKEYRDVPCQSTVLSATSSLVKLLWWSRQPFYSRARYFLHQADWLGFLLHGQLGISDYHNSLKLGYDVAELQYPDWLQQMAIAPLLPQVVAPGTSIAPIQPQVAEELGFSPHCQICAGTTDSIAAFLASDATLPGEAVTSLGSTLVLKLLSQTPVESSQYGIYSHRLGDAWLVGGASNTGGAVLQHFFTTSELERLSLQIVSDRPSTLDYYPLLKPGERFPINDPQLSPRLEPQPDDQAEFLHGLLEGMARIEARGYQLLQDLGATPLNRVYTAGGGAANPTWTTIRARYLGVPVLKSVQTEAAYGTATLAARSVNSRFQDGKSSPDGRP